MSKGVFREKSAKRVSSPEQLNDYIRVTNPSVYLLLGAVIIFLISVCIWCVTGTLDITVDAKGYSDGAILWCYLDEEDIQHVQKGMEVHIGDHKGSVESVAEVPESWESMAERLGGEDMAHALRIPDGAWRYLVTISEEKSVQGILDVSIVTDRISPAVYIFN